MLLTGKTVVVTGAARGIGRAIALCFAQQKANIALLDTNAEALERCRSECEAVGAVVRCYPANVAREQDVSAAMSSVAREFNQLDVLINNAGITRDGLLLKVKEGQVVGKLGLDRWQDVLDVNLTGVFLCAREAAEQMVIAGRGGVIVNISSISRHGNVGQTNYAASKAGVVAMTTTWARELAAHGIRVAAIAPGFIETDILATVPQPVLQNILAAVPLRRLGRAEEVARTASFIVENDFLTGRCVDLDGGLRL